MIQRKTCDEDIDMIIKIVNAKFAKLETPVVDRI
jgi:hypothetical protein